MTIGARRVRFTVEQYDRMGETGILPDDPRIELLYGHIIARESPSPRHAGTVGRLHRDPVDGRYRSVHTLARRDTLAPLALPDVRVSVEDLIGP